MRGSVLGKGGRKPRGGDFFTVGDEVQGRLLWRGKKECSNESMKGGKKKGEGKNKFASLVWGVKWNAFKGVQGEGGSLRFRGPRKSMVFLGEKKKQLVGRTVKKRRGKKGVILIKGTRSTEKRGGISITKFRERKESYNKHDHILYWRKGKKKKEDDTNMWWTQKRKLKRQILHNLQWKLPQPLRLGEKWCRNNI